MTPQEILTAAADLIEEKAAITQGGDYYDDAADCYCALGAIAKVTGYDFDGSYGSVSRHLTIDGTRCEAAQTLAEHLGMDAWHEIPTWNDYEVPGWQEVVTAMREAAAS